MWQVAAFKKGRIKYGLMFDAAVNQSLRRAGAFAQDHVRTEAEFKRRSTVGASAKDATTYRLLSIGKSKRVIRLENKKKHARYLEFGTRPHVIRARRKKALRFKIGGSVFLRRRVNHPGTKAYKFLQKAGEAALQELHKDLSRRLRRLGK